MSLFKQIILTFAAICFMSAPSHAQSLTVACAGNFTAAMKKLAALYEKETGTKIICTFGSTGMLYGQITNGAPFDLFFAADEKRPAKLFKAGLAQKPAPYARGKVILWSSKKSLATMDSWEKVVASPEVAKVGIASPKTAPYGLRAEEAMTKADLTDTVKAKLVFGKNVGMAFQFAYSGAAEASFAALSQALSEKGATGKYWLVPEAGAVKQSACILTKGNQETAAAFLSWLATPAAKDIITGYGYE